MLIFYIQDGGWSNWTSQGVGIRVSNMTNIDGTEKHGECTYLSELETRTCDDPEPSNGGADCDGETCIYFRTAPEFQIHNLSCKMN